MLVWVSAQGRLMWALTVAFLVEPSVLAAVEQHRCEPVVPSSATPAVLALL
jgi:hypothetical protein